ncbi:hypothetical protein ACJ72_08852, partial [Emergomyces africanus]
MLAEVAASPLTDQEKEDLLHQWSDVDGSLVSLEQILHPSPDLLPYILANPDGFSLKHGPWPQTPKRTVPRALRRIPGYCEKTRC